MADYLTTALLECSLLTDQASIRYQIISIILLLALSIHISVLQGSTNNTTSIRVHISVLIRSTDTTTSIRVHIILTCY